MNDKAIFAPTGPVCPDQHVRICHFQSPTGTLDRARQDSLTQFLLDEFDAALWLAARHSFVLPEQMRLGAIRNTLRWEFERSQKTLNHRIGEADFAMGEKMTVPDFILEMRFRGHPENLIRKVVYENPIEFFSQSENFSFTPPNVPEAAIQG